MQNRTTSIVSIILSVGLLTTAAFGQLVYENNATENSRSTEDSNDDNVVTTTMENTDGSANALQDESECICTPFNLCKSYESAANGEELIDIR